MSNQKRNCRASFLLGVLFTVAVMLAGSFIRDIFFAGRGVDEPGSDASQSKVREIDRLIEKEYLFETDEEQLAQGMYAGMVDGLGDKYSCYYTEQEYREVLQSNEGHYEGIGVVLMQDKNTGQVAVAYCYEDSPAALAGVQEGDVIYRLNDQSVVGQELSQVAGLIRESEEKVIALTVYRESEDQYIDLTVEKAEVEIPSVSAKMLEDQIGYIAIYQFTAMTAEQFAQAYESLQKQQMKSLIVDLRDNPGGLLSGVCDTLETFMPEGLLVYTEDKKGMRTEHSCKGKTPIEIPLVVLVNENSASAAEIFAGAVKDHGVGTLVGTTTYGKGIVQKSFTLGDGSVVKLTISSYYTPSGINIHGTGIEPDEKVEQSQEGDEDLQLQRAREILEQTGGN